LFLAIHLGLSLFPTLGWAGALVFEPRTFTKGPGGPETFQVTFSVADPQGTFWLVVFNGTDGEKLVKSGLIRLNGVEVARPKDFHEATRLQFHFTKDVSLQAVSVLEVELRGKEGNLITIEIRRAEPNPTISNRAADLSGRNAGDGIDLWWAPDEKATEYIVFRALSIDGPWEELGRLPGHRPNGFDFTPDARVRDLCYRVEAVDASGRVIHRYEPICVPKFVEEQQSLHHERSPTIAGVPKPGRIGPAAPQNSFRFASLSLQATTQNPPINELCLSDCQFTNFRAMSLDQIRAFLKDKGSFLQSRIKDVDGVEIDPAQELFNAAQTSQISLQVLLTTLEKEQGAVTAKVRLKDQRLRLIMGFDPEHKVVPLAGKSIREQIRDAAAQFRRDFDRLSRGEPTAGGWQVGVAKLTDDNIIVTPTTKTAAVLYSFTPVVGAQWGGKTLFGGNSRFCKFWSDFGFAAFIKDKKKILWDNAHAAQHGVPGNYSTFIEILRQEGYIVETAETELTSSLLSNFDLLVTVDPTKAFTPEEVEAIIEFVATGGGLWVMGEWFPRWEGQELVNAFLSPLGITMNKDAIGGQPFMALQPHPVSEGVSSIQLWDFASLTLSETAVPIGLIDSRVILAANEFGCGRVLVIGDEIVVSQFNNWLFQADNLTFGLNAVAWLTSASP